ncbi:helix-turn-helix domain-containing protein [Rhodopseudomonas palustris]|uniref:Transcriptional regulator, AraC family n=1 Tax=Rhodopseudomonas palustris (strain BisB18) TaxID=316056 RepID=Q212E0_RHOPB
MPDDPCPGSGHLMLISPERVFYAGLLGRPRRRSIGGFAIYTALQGELRVAIEGRSTLQGVLAIVPPYIAHSVDSDHPTISSLVIEPETVDPQVFDQLTRRCTAQADQLAARIRGGYAELRRAQRRNGFTTGEFDTLFFGEALAARGIDGRIARAIALLNDVSGKALTATRCAAAAKLSPSRFLHLFKEQTGVSFRAFRAWKRARHLLHFVNAEINLAHLAQDIGYPDSTHFSHSIRRFYGLKPRAIFSGSRDLAIYRGEPRSASLVDLRPGRA